MSVTPWDVFWWIVAAGAGLMAVGVLAGVVIVVFTAATAYLTERYK